MFLPLMGHLRVGRETGRPRTRPDAVRGDKAYSSRAIRSHLRGRGIKAVIPEPDDQKGHRKRRGSRGGRPVGLDAADIEKVATFWAGLYEGEVVRADADWYEIRVGHDYPVAVQRAADHVRPDWPDGQPQQVHLDFFVEDIRSEHERVMALGAELLQAADDVSSATGFQVYADPAGHPFCLCWGWQAWRDELRRRARG